MAETLTEPKKHLALDTDWRAAAGMAVLFVICALLGGRRLFEIVRGVKPEITVTWDSSILLCACVSGFISRMERCLRTASLIMALSVGSKILLHVLKATVETQLANAALLRVLYVMLWTGGCTGVFWWFRSKVRYV
jgi:hypothetical protein